jgi:hypothetical protein
VSPEEIEALGGLPVVKCPDTHWWIEREDGSTVWLFRCETCGADV